MAILTLTTDFGEGSHYVAQMKGAILSIDPGATIVDITHGVPPQDVRAGGAVVAAAAVRFPSDAIHVVVVDPGVGSTRAIVYVEMEIGRFVLPDNGLLTSLASGYPPLKIVAVENPEFWASQVSRTFHGRDIMAPVAARLGLGLDPDQLGPRRSGLVQIELREARRVGQTIEGEVVDVDSFGNLVTNITREMLAAAPRDESLAIRCDGHETFGLYETYSDQPEMTLLALIGSSDQLELAIVNDSAAAMLGVRAGAPVVVRW
ncbi:MAG: SAM-dependent chlorinase/fluorinase [Planctomycetales bacterium]|nr:SAM-dependent chlorinase/fluorinase [Planctomycetales bacterium]